MAKERIVVLFSPSLTCVQVVPLFIEKKAPLLKERLIFPEKEILYAKDSLDGYNISISQKGRLDLDYIAQLTGKDKDTIIKELLDKYKRTGKIGNTTPRNMEHAQQIANAIAYETKSESFANVIELCTILNSEDIDEKKKKSKKKKSKKRKRHNRNSIIGYPLLYGHYGDDDDDDDDGDSGDSCDGGGGD